MDQIVNFLADNAFLTMLFTNVVQAVGWFFAFRRRRIENDSGEASALDSIRELNNKVAADLKERYDEQEKRINELEERERKAFREIGVLNGQVEVLTRQNLSDMDLIHRLNVQITSYKNEVSSWKTKFEGLQKQVSQFKKHEK